MEFRALTLARLQAFARQRFMSVADYMADPLRFQAALEALSFCDYSLSIKAGVRTHIQFPRSMSLLGCNAPFTVIALVLHLGMLMELCNHCAQKSISDSS